MLTVQGEMGRGAAYMSTHIVDCKVHNGNLRAIAHKSTLFFRVSYSRCRPTHSTCTLKESVIVYIRTV